MRKPVGFMLLTAGVLTLASPAAAQPVLPAFTQNQTRPVFVGLLILASIIAGLWLVRALMAIRQQPEPIAWRAALRTVGWLPLLATAGTLIFGWIIGDDVHNPLPIFQHMRLIESVVPIAIGLQAAFLFSPDDEPGLEVVMACPRPLAWLLLERLGVLLLLQTIIALTGTALTVRLTGAEPLMILLRWTAPSLLFAGVAVFITLRSRNALFGLMMTGCLWFALVLFAEVFIPGSPILYPLNYVQPFGWGVHPFMQPEILQRSDYLLNRGLVALLGLVMLGLAVRELSNQERMLLGTDQARGNRTRASE